METTSSFTSRICKKRLIDELERLEKERSSSLRLLQASRNLFQKRFHKFTLPLSRKGSEAASIQMFDTHSPGFCYRRNGDCRSSDRLQQKETTSLTDAQAMLQMLLTAGEVDIEKVVCLHLLAFHLPPGAFAGGQLQRGPRGWVRSGSGQQTSSKPADPGPRSARGLPAYVVNLVPHLSSASSGTQCMMSAKSKEDIEEAKGTVPLLLNVQIERLVESAFEVLQKVNPTKVDAMMELIKSPASLRLMLSTKKIRTFLDLLQSAAILSNEEAFVPATVKLYQKPRTPRLSERPKGVSVLTVADANISLQRFISQLRSKIFEETDIVDALGLPGSMSKMSLRSFTGPFSMSRKWYSAAGCPTPESQLEKASTFGGSTFSLHTISTEEDDVRPTENPTAEPSTEQEGETVYPVPNKIVRKTTVAGFSRSGTPLVYPVVRKTSKPKEDAYDGANIAGRRKLLTHEQKTPWSMEATAGFKWSAEAGNEFEKTQVTATVSSNQLRTTKAGEKNSSPSPPLPPPPLLRAGTLTQEAVAGFRLDIATSELCRRLQNFLKVSAS